MASLHDLRLDALRNLVDDLPCTLQAVCKDAELPLHKACRRGHLDVVNELLQRDMTSAGARNSSGMLPLFLLCQLSGKKSADEFDSPAFVETVWNLLIAHPEAVKTV